MGIQTALYAAIAAAGWCAGKANGAQGQSTALATTSNALSTANLPQPTPGILYADGRGVEVRPELLNFTNETLQAAGEVQKAWRQERDLEQLKDRIHQNVKRQAQCTNEQDRPAPYAYTNTAGVARTVDCSEGNLLYSSDAATRPLRYYLDAYRAYYTAPYTVYQTLYRSRDCSAFGWNWQHCVETYASPTVGYDTYFRTLYRELSEPDLHEQFRKTACRKESPTVFTAQIGYNPNPADVAARTVPAADLNRLCSEAVARCQEINNFACQTPTPTPSPTPSPSISESISSSIAESSIGSSQATSSLGFTTSYEASSAAPEASSSSASSTPSETPIATPAATPGAEDVPDTNPSTLPTVEVLSPQQDDGVGVDEVTISTLGAVAGAGIFAGAVTLTTVLLVKAYKNKVIPPPTDLPLDLALNDFSKVPTE